MLSRGNTTASARLRRAKSSTSVKPRGNAQETDHIDPRIARQHALTAANLAFDRGGGNGGILGKNHGLMPGSGHTQMIGEDQKPLRRRQSIRFMGATAVPTRDRSITRRNAPTYHDIDSLLHQQTPQLSRSLSATEDSPNNLTALPPIESMSSTTSSYRKVRKSKSMFSSRKGLPFTFSNATPKSFDLRSHCGRLSDHEGRLPVKPSCINSFESDPRSTRTNTSHPYTHAYDQDAAIQLARNQYIIQLERQSLKGHPSMLSLKKRTSQKPFRRTVRTSSSNSYGTALGSAQQPVSVKTKTLELRARNLSVTLKNKLRSVFQRNASLEKPFPYQQIEARRPHFGDYLTATSGLDVEGPLPPTPPEELISRVSSRSPSLHRLPVHLDRRTSPGSIRSVRSNSPSTGRSRISSWAHSTATNTLTKQQLLDKKRLSIIQENGGPHQPSSSAGLIGVAARRGYAAFRKPLRGVNGSGKINDQVDPQRIYSALQKRLDEHHQRHSDNILTPFRYPNEDESQRRPSIKSRRETSLESQIDMKKSVRMLSNHSEDSLQGPHNIRSTRSVSFFDKDPTDRNGDIVRPASVTRKALNPTGGFSKEGLTFQQIAQQNETGDHSIRRPLREVKSAFFPSTAHYQTRDTSPYRRALRSNTDEEKIAESQQLPRRTIGIFPPAQIHLGAPADNSVSSGSVYSRSPNGTPKPFETSMSLARSGSDGEPGTVTLFKTAPSPLLQSARLPSQNAPSSTISNAGWKSSLISEAETCERKSFEWTSNSNHCKTRISTHHRENAQIDGDDIIVSDSRRRQIGADQPLSAIQFTASARPSSRRRTSDQTVEKVPLRYPLIERNTSSTSIATLKISSSPTSRHSKNRSHKVSVPSVVRHSSSRVLQKPMGSGLRDVQAPNHLTLDQGNDTRTLTDQTNNIAALSWGGRGKTQPQSSPDSKGRHSPERVERLRRMQSSGAIKCKENVKISISAIQLQGHQQENQAINDLTAVSSHRGNFDTHGSNLFQSITSETRAAASQKMVDLFLSKNRSDGFIAGESSPAFI
ncbi:hypothetical protein MMC19_003999 [Ptychographa xylographoides]|nr:hypothetical protein [Ptychographa xylographoides]